jgi:hypothetical protein
MTLYVVIKGNAAEAALAMAHADIGCQVRYEHPRFNETVVLMGNQHEERIRSMFHAADCVGAPYPPGTVLLWSRQ